MTDRGILTGTRVVLQVATIEQPDLASVIGLLTDVSITDGIEWAALKVLGQITTPEFAPVDYNITVDAGRFIRLPGLGNDAAKGLLRQQGIFPNWGGTDQDFLVNCVSLGLGLSGTVVDQVTQAEIMVIRGLLPAQRTLTVTANALTQERLTFVAKVALDPDST